MVAFLLLNPDFKKGKVIKQLLLSESGLEKDSYDGRGWANNLVWNLVCFDVAPNSKGGDLEGREICVDYPCVTLSTGSPAGRLVDASRWC